jgi:uncharacterized RDD family membrane protein YckC
VTRCPDAGAARSTRFRRRLHTLHGMSSSQPPPPPPPPPPIGDDLVGAVAGGRPLASPGMRVLARFLDSLIVSILFGFVLSAIVLGGSDDGGFGGLGADASFGELYVLAVLNAAAYFVWDGVFTKQFGGTPMKLAFGMRVVQQNGADVEWSHAIKRWAIPGAFGLVPLPALPSLANLVVVIVSLVFIFSKPLRTAVWDMFADTMVISVR